MATEMIRIDTMSDQDRELINLLTPAERLAALRSAGAHKVADMFYTLRSKPMTRKRLEALLAEQRPDLAIDEINGNKGWYRVSAGPAASFRSGYQTWKDIAMELELIPVEDHEQDA